jgi:hypothetical protein
VVVVDDPTYIPNKSIRPLMKNWTEAEAERRSQYDYANGRGRGKVKVLFLSLLLATLYHSRRCVVILIYDICFLI